MIHATVSRASNVAKTLEIVNRDVISYAIIICIALLSFPHKKMTSLACQTHVRLENDSLVNFFSFLFLPATQVYFVTELARATKHQVGLALIISMLLFSLTLGFQVCVWRDWDASLDERG